MRTCVVCRTRREETALARAGRASGAWYLGRGTGRGVWWCASGECVGRLAPGHLARALREPAGEEDLADLLAKVARRDSVEVVEE